MRKVFYELVYKCNKRFSLCSDESVDYFDKHFIGKRMKKDFPRPKFELSLGRRPILDFISLVNWVPVISERAKAILEPLIKEDCQIFELATIREKKLYVINVLSSVRGFEDPTAGERSIFTGASSTSSSVFVNQAFADLVVSEKLYGACFVDPDPDRDGYYLIAEGFNDLEKFYI